MINLNGVDLDFRMTDVDFYESYMENAKVLDSVMNEDVLDEDKDYKKVVDLFRRRCTAMKQFLDNLFGEGTGERVCGENDDILICAGVYLDMCNEIKKLGLETQKKINTKKGNRQQRRTTKKS